MRTTWNGSISFGLVSIPVGLAPATRRRPAVRRAVPDAPPRVPDADQAEALVPRARRRGRPDELVRGWEISKGQFVPVEDAELEALEQRDTSRAIEITRFVAAGEVDPVYFDRTYYLVPAGTEAQRRPYALLLEAMREDGVVGIGSFVLAGKEKLCLIRPKGDALALETLFVAEDVKARTRSTRPSRDDEVKKEELALARQLIAGSRASSSPRSCGASTAPSCASCSRRRPRAASCPSRSRRRRDAR